MGLADEIRKAVTDVVCSDWDIRKGTTVPEKEDVKLKNGAVELDAVYLYADMADSTGLARDFSRTTAAKVMRSYLDATCRVIRARGGEIRSFDGDRVMAIFIGNGRYDAAARCALQINYVVSQIVRPKVEDNLPSIKSKGFIVKHCVGIDAGTALVVRGGVHGTNDLASVGRAPNVAAKLSDIRNDPWRTYITQIVFNRLIDAKYSKGSKRELMWEGPYSRDVGGENMTVYKSSWRSEP
ncbi:adenylate/guanylate cyclase domain-containing protein [Streptomyces anandii]|uniref:adenylate/guanylate cyclase domain-containing protein n=1 Tax=Streptomyces anandii TaxID=285454 RepID=UPI000B2306C1|nr:adenylate/guanylate cyclase domain-containing protein [Streptomyces anandii]GGX89957.1 guanylate cyclase [Streptomyces anandii JCM 4720]